MNIKHIDCHTLTQWLENDEAILIDVREPAEHKSMHIKGAMLLPLRNVCYNALPSTDKKVVMHCLKGSRGTSACKKLTAERHNLEMYHLEGGITAWQEAGLPVESKGGKSLPLDRQVQLAIGLSVLSASLLAYFVNMHFNFVAAFFGAGLTFAGLTGFCGLARGIAKMPWNK